MVAHRLSGEACADRIKKSVKIKVDARLKQGLARPGLAVILIGHNPASEAYVAHKQKACDETGIYSELHRLPETCTPEAITQKIGALNQNLAIHGILLQLPLPPHIPADDLLECIDPKKDVDGFHPYNMGRLVERRPLLRPCTPYGIMELVKEIGENLVGINAVVVGQSNIVGRPMALELLLAGCTVTICHSKTQNLKNHVEQADLLVAAVGKPGVIQSEWIKPGAIVIDVGFNRLSSGKIVGDIEFETAQEKASWITPVPGGVGLMTVAMLLENTLQAAHLLNK
ncbi:MAG TPA: bifunctional methylenetetrahydrofolate dehydrogenase/methenyltetrahydrofolate cyclohydrolase FolD [Coxiellaceae bacterium]|nr:bifunctional methylenetetrahydrofolate dehydrogenase/methenyltetrahydrofolate cyclohydrolase FolD [Coxiellaceae bacterium]